MYGHLHLRYVQVFLPSRVIGSHRRALWLVTFICEMFKYDCLLVLSDPTGEPCGWSPLSPRCSSIPAFSCYRIQPESHVYGFGLSDLGFRFRLVLVYVLLDVYTLLCWQIPKYFNSVLLRLY